MMRRANLPTAPRADLPDVKYGFFTPALEDHAKQDGWTVVSMKDDWKQVFPAAQSEITAIDILLEPDATMLQHSAANNARLLKVFPKGFALDATHTPHITMIQCFVRTADLDQVYAAAGKGSRRRQRERDEAGSLQILLRSRPARLGVAGICAKPTPEILKLQADIIAAASPFTVETGPIGAFTAAHDNPAIDAAHHRLCVDVRAEDERRAFQSARQHRRRPGRISRPDARRTV